MLSLWVLRFTLLSMLIFSYKGPWAVLIHADWDHQVSMWLVVTALMVATLWVGSKIGKLTSLLPLTLLCSVIMILVVAIEDKSYAVYFQVFDNIALVVTGVWLILRGTLNRISHYYFLGIGTILLTAFMRYVDLIGDYIDSALLFIGLSVILLGAARYWKVRQGKELQQ